MAFVFSLIASFKSSGVNLNSFSSVKIMFLTTPPASATPGV